MSKDKEGRGKRDPKMRPEAVALRALREMVADLAGEVRALREETCTRRSMPDVPCGGSAPVRPACPTTWEVEERLRAAGFRYPHNPYPLSIALPPPPSGGGLCRQCGCEVSTGRQYPLCPQ